MRPNHGKGVGSLFLPGSRQFLAKSNGLAILHIAARGGNWLVWSIWSFWSLWFVWFDERERQDRPRTR